MGFDYAICLLVLSTILNSAVLFIVYKRRPSKPLDILMLHSSVCGFLFCITIILQREFPSNLLIYAVIWFFGLGRVFMLVLLAGQRFIAVYLPLKAKSLLTKRHTYIFIYIVYIFILGNTTTVSVMTALGIVKRNKSSRGFMISVVGTTLFTLSCYLAIFVRLYRLKREGYKKKLRPSLFSLLITASNLTSSIPLIMEIYKVTVYVPKHLIWFDSACNPLLYIGLMRWKFVEQVFRKIFNM